MSVLIVVCEQCSWLGSEAEAGSSLRDVHRRVGCRRCGDDLSVYRPFDPAHERFGAAAMRLRYELDPLSEVASSVAGRPSR